MQQQISTTSDLKNFAQKAFENLGMPHPGHERWKYTRFQSYWDRQRQDSRPLEQMRTSDFTQAKNKITQKNCLQFHHNLGISDSSTLTGASIGHKQDLDKVESLKGFIDTLKDHYHNDALFFKSLTDTLDQDLNITVLNLDQDQSVNLCYDDFEDRHNKHQFLVVKVAKGVHIKLQQWEGHYTSHGEQKAHMNRHMMFLLGQDATVEHTILSPQYHGEQYSQLNYISAQVQRNASYTNRTYEMGCNFSRWNLYVDLTGEQAQAEHKLLYQLSEEQHLDTCSYFHHRHHSTRSNQLVKAILADQAKGIFNGRIYIPKKSQNVEAYQLHRTLLMSKKAHNISLPQLEIYADDVKCSHGSTTGQLQPEELFYLQSRGISESKARALLCEAFAIEVINELSDPDLRTFITLQFLNNQKNKHNS